MKVVPALLEQQVDLQKMQLLNLSKHYSRFQVDIADNTLVPNTTTQIDGLLHSSFFNLVSHVIFDFHLMVSDPKKHIEMIKSLPKKRVGIILIHKSVFPDYSLITNRYPLFRFGLVLNPEDDVMALSDALIISLPAIQIMTIKPGFQGSPFVEESLNKIEQLRKRGFKKEILIDGSVNDKTLPIILSLQYKPDILSVGSFLTKSPKNKFEKRIKYLNSTTGSMV
jgi:pentose-5-phosphate-3-epimerase